MENNHILIGLVVLTISCIYLFYLNFQKHQEFEELHIEVKKLKLLNGLTQNKLMEIAVSKQNNIGSLTKRNLENLDIGISKDKLNTLIEKERDTDDEEKTDIDLNFSTDEIKEINDLETADLETADLETADLETADLETADLETADLETADLETADLETTIDNLVIDGEELEELEELDVNHNSEENTMLNIEEKIETKNEGKLEMENLDSMTLKELKVIAKNMNIKTKGNKDELIHKIKIKISN
jgi:hypothetical protein